ncbi:hypothetical protein B0T13DRAFT_509054 [Neurospora crassa]|nr:hypothetical protein B0T13DRAFT_509054 [Neurospora crassa]
MVFPSSGIRPMEVHRVHLQHGKRLAGRVEALTNKCLVLVTEQPEDETTTSTFDADDRPRGLGPVLVRGLQFLAQDVHAWDLLQIDNMIGREEVHVASSRESALSQNLSAAFRGKKRAKTAETVCLKIFH